MEPRLANRQKVRNRRGADEVATLAKPLVRPAPRSAMFFPLVVLVAVLPGLYALRNWDLNPPGPWWGLRGLAVLEGRIWDQVGAPGMGVGIEERAYRSVALQPPSYAWLEAAGLALAGDRNPIASVLPSYLAGTLVVILVYLHGRLWRGPGVGLLAAILTGFNHDLLVQMQQATPATLALAGILAALLAYARHARDEHGGTIGWGVAGGLALGLSLLSVGWLGLIVVPVVLVHQIYLGPDPTQLRRSPGRRPRCWRTRPALVSGALAMAVGVAIALPWHLSLFWRHGSDLLTALAWPPYSGGGPRTALLARLLALAPATLPLGLYAALRSARRALVAEDDDPETSGGVFWLGWLGVAAILPALWPGGPRHAMGIFLMVPLNLLAAVAMTDLAARRIPARSLAWLAPTTACSVAWSLSGDMRGAVESLVHFRSPDSATALGLHIGLDLALVLFFATRALDRWARRRDDRRRLILAGFIALVLASTVSAGLREVRFRHKETTDLLALRDVILRRQRIRPFTLVAVVGPAPAPPELDLPPPGGRLRFLLRSTLPRLAQLDLSSTDDLLGLPEGSRLVILAGSANPLPYAMQSRLDLEAIHPGRSGVLDAFATAMPERR